MCTPLGAATCEDRTASAIAGLLKTLIYGKTLKAFPPMFIKSRWGPTDTHVRTYTISS